MYKRQQTIGEWNCAIMGDEGNLNKREWGIVANSMAEQNLKFGSELVA